MNIDTAVEKDPVALDAVVDTSGGVREVFHDETLDGKGTKKDPLRVNKNVIATKEDLESKADKATTLAGYGITDAYTKEEINTKFGSVYHVKGSVATYNDLPDDAGVGDVYNILDSGSNYVWTGTEWDKLSETVDLSDYATKSELEEKQDKLNAGTNIVIENNVISSTAQESFFRGRYANWDAVPTNGSAYPNDINGNHTPSNTDYIIIEDSSTVPGGQVEMQMTMETDRYSSYPTGKLETVINGITYNGAGTFDDGNIQVYCAVDGGNYTAYWKTLKNNVEYQGVTYEAGSVFFKVVITPAKNTTQNAKLSLGNPYTGSWRFSYRGTWDLDNKNGWKAEYQIEEVLPIATETQAGINRIYTAGNNVTIENNVISVDAGDKLPDQTDNAGKFLQTNGSEASWQSAIQNNATDSNSVYIGNDLPQYADDGKGNVLIGPASKITGLGTGNTVIGMGAYGKGYDGTSLGRSALSEGQWAVAVGYSANANDSGTVAVGCTAVAKSENSVAIGHQSNSSGSWGIAIGKGANVTANGSTAIAIGASSSATGINSISLGTNTRVNSNSEAAVALGANAIANKNGNTVVGSKANAQDVYATAVGYQSQAKGTASVAIGMNAKTTIAGDNGYNQIAIGNSSNTEGKGAIAIGAEGYAFGENSLAVGKGASVANVFHSIAIGSYATATPNNNEEGMLAHDVISIGSHASGNAYQAVAIGSNAEAAAPHAIVIGGNAESHAKSAIQLGEGINTEEGSLQVYDYTLLRENGVIPYGRLSDFNSPSNGQVLAYNEEEDALYWKDAGGGVSEVKWGDITGSITDQTDLSTQFSNLSQSISDINDTIMEMTTKDESLQTQIDNLSAIGQFLAIWDCDTHIARYLTEGHEYQSGNYFIIGSVAAEGGTNYMPNGASYPGYAVTTEDVKVSDMWFYDGEHWIYLANHERAIAVDAELNAESINPVENKAVTAAIVELQNRPTGVGVPQLASVDVLQIKTPEEATERERNYGSWKGMYSDIVVTLNLNKQEIIDRMYDLYLTVSRFKTNRNLTYDADGEDKNYRNIPKFSVMNDLRQKTNIRAYCWRMIYDDSLPETHPGRYAYFYTQDLYVDEQACLEYAHDIGLWGDYGSVACGPATCLNAIGWTNGYSANEYLHDYGDTTVGIERYEEGDISEFANVADTGTYPEYNLKDLLTKRECRRYTRDGENYYFWCSNWDDSNAEIYNLTDGNDNPIPNGIPKHMDQLRYVWNVFDLPSTFEFVDKRPDLNYKAVSDPYGFLEALQNLTFKGKYVDGDGRPTYWNCYWFDFPIMPVLLKDCEVRVLSNATKEDYSASVNSGEWHTLEYLSNNGLLHGLRDDKPIEIKLPYDTYYLWMRFCSLQKRCAYGDYSNWLDEEGRGIDNPMWPEQKINLVEGVRDYNVLGRRAFARPRQAYRYNEYAKISEYVQFNVCSPMDAASGTKSKATPIQKKLTIDIHATTTIRN